MKHLTFGDLCEIFRRHNTDNNITSQFADKNPLTGVIVFKQGKWFNAEYSEEERTYVFDSDNKYFISGMGGNSIFGDCITGSEKGIRLDWYIRDWEIDYCYIK